MLHVVISWDLRAVGARASELERQLKTSFDAYNNVRVLPNTYVVGIPSAEIRRLISSALQAIARDAPEKPHIVISPTMDGGSYAGFLPTKLWPQLNELTG